MNVDVMKSYEELFGKSSSQTSLSDQCHPNEAIARIVQNPDGTRRLEPTGLADTTSPEFQRLLGPQGSLASRLGLSGIGAGGAKEKKEELLDCVEKDLNDFGNNPALGRLNDEILLCNLGI